MIPVRKRLFAGDDDFTAKTVDDDKGIVFGDSQAPVGGIGKIFPLSGNPPGDIGNVLDGLNIPEQLEHCLVADQLLGTLFVPE